MGVNLCDLNLGKDLLDMTLNVQSIKKKSDFLKIRNGVL